VSTHDAVDVEAGEEVDDPEGDVPFVLDEDRDDVSDEPPPHAAATAASVAVPRSPSASRRVTARSIGT
jgi:hypothetical protein